DPRGQGNREHARLATSPRTQGQAQGDQDGVVVPRGPGADPLAIQPRVFLVKQGVEQALPLLVEADSPARGPHGVHDERGWNPVDLSTMEQQGEVQVAILAPGRRESLVEAPDLLEDLATDEAVRRDEFSPLEPGGVALVVG